MASHRHPIAPGFTLVELGIGLAVIAVLITIVTAGTQGYQRAAMGDRVASDLKGIYSSVSYAIAREMNTNYGGGGALFTMEATDVGFNNNQNQPVVLSLAQVDQAFQSSTAAAGDADAMGLPRNPDGSVRDQNPFGRPYQVILRRRQLTLASCVPENFARADLACDNNTFVNVGCVRNVEQCVAISGTMMPKGYSRLGFSYKYLYQGTSTPPVAETRTDL
jgi:type II secretory pathway pseudopilin PulG